MVSVRGESKKRKKGLRWHDSSVPGRAGTCGNDAGTSPLEQGEANVSPELTQMASGSVLPEPEPSWMPMPQARTKDKSAEVLAGHSLFPLPHPGMKSETSAS